MKKGICAFLNCVASYSVMCCAFISINITAVQAKGTGKKHVDSAVHDTQPAISDTQQTTSDTDEAVRKVVTEKKEKKTKDFLKKKKSQSTAEQSTQNVTIKSVQDTADKNLSTDESADKKTDKNIGKNDKKTKSKNKGKSKGKSKNQSNDTGNAQSQKKKPDNDSTKKNNKSKKKKKKPLGGLKKMLKPKNLIKSAGKLSKKVIKKKKSKKVIAPKHLPDFKPSTQIQNQQVLEKHKPAYHAYDPYNQDGLPIVTIDPPASNVDLLQGLPLALFMPPDGLQHIHTLPDDHTDES